jgi:hypothetical protein
MDFRKIQSMGGGESAGVSLPKDQLRELGFIDEDGSVVEAHARIEHVGGNEFSVEILE